MRIATVLLATAAVSMAACAPDDTASDTAATATMAAASPQDAFWTRLQALCEAAAPGELLQAPDEQIPPGAALVVHFWECGEGELRFPLHVNDNRSRTWVFIRHDDHLELRHDHRHEDGTEDAISQYGGDAPRPGLAERQIFPADAHTASILPLRADNFWFFHFVDDQRLHYGVHWPKMGHSIRVEFDLSTPVEPPPRPWGY